MSEQPRSEPYFVAASEAEYEDGVRCVVMPCCGFTFSAEHVDHVREAWDGGDQYSCPICEPGVAV